jgi:hypothetical protein
MNSILVIARALGVSEELLERASLSPHDQELLERITRELDRLGAFEYPPEVIRAAPVIFSSPYNWELEPGVMGTNVYIGPMWVNEVGGISDRLRPGAGQYLALYVSLKGKNKLQTDLMVHEAAPNTASLAQMREELQERTEDLKAAYLSGDPDDLFDIGEDAVHEIVIPMWATREQAEEIIEYDDEFEHMLMGQIEESAYTLIESGDDDDWDDDAIDADALSEDWNRDPFREIWLTEAQVNNMAGGRYRQELEERYHQAVADGLVSEDEDEEEDW